MLLAFTFVGAVGALACSRSRVADEAARPDTISNATKPPESAPLADLAGHDGGRAAYDAGVTRASADEQWDSGMPPATEVAGRAVEKMDAGRASTNASPYAQYDSGMPPVAQYDSGMPPVAQYDSGMPPLAETHDAGRSGLSAWLVTEWDGGTP
jgi:hypothetical protein